MLEDHCFHFPSLCVINKISPYCVPLLSDKGAFARNVKPHIPYIISSSQTFYIKKLYLNTAYAAHYVKVKLHGTIFKMTILKSSPVSSQRLGHSKCDAPSQLFTPDSQPRHDGSKSSGGSAIVMHRHMWRTVTANIFSLTHS